MKKQKEKDSEKPKKPVDDNIIKAAKATRERKLAESREVNK